MMDNNSNYKERIKGLESKIKQYTETVQENMKGELNKGEEYSIHLGSKIMSALPLMHLPHGKTSILSFLLGVSGVALATGFALVPGLGFILGLFVGVYLNDDTRHKILDILAKSSDKVTSTAKDISLSIQNNWEKFDKALKDEVQHFDEIKDNINDKGKDIESTIHNFINKFHEHK